MAAIGTGWADGAWVFGGWAVGAWDGTATVVLSGSVSDGASENEIKTGLEELFITLKGVSWNSGQAFNDSRQVIIDGLDSAGAEAQGWNAEIRDQLIPSVVTRLSDRVVKIVFPATPTYEIASNETITVTVDASTNSHSSNLTASPFAITANSETGITNTGATLTPSQFEICDRSGFRQLPNTLVRDGYNYRTRAASADNRHPQELVRSRADKQPGSVAPEQDDRFLLNNEVTTDDL